MPLARSGLGNCGSGSSKVSGKSPKSHGPEGKFNVDICLPRTADSWSFYSTGCADVSNLADWRYWGDEQQDDLTQSLIFSYLSV